MAGDGVTARDRSAKWERRVVDAALASLTHRRLPMGMSLVLPPVLQRMADARPHLAGLTGEAKARFQRLQLDGVQKHVIRAAVINSALAALLVPFLTPTFG